MNLLRVLTSRVLGLFAGRRRDGDLNDELQAHLDLLAEQHVGRGMSAAEARLAARREFGGVEQMKEVYRDRRTLPLAEELAKDLRYACRLLVRSPLFTLTALLSLAIGIGANTAIFTVVNALLLRPPAEVAEPARLVDIGRTQNGAGFDTSSYPTYLDLRARSTLLSGVYAYRLDPQPLSLAAEDGAERVYGLPVSANYFTALGAVPQLGRFFTLEDGEQIGATPLVVLSHRLWVRQFHMSPAIIGQTVILNGHPFSIIGVAPQGFQGTTALAMDLWVPLAMTGEVMPRIGSRILASRAATWLMIGARLRPEVTIKQAQAEVASLALALGREFPDDNRGKGLVLRPISTFPGSSDSVARYLALLMAIVGLVLVIACVNLAGVLLARSAARRREIAVRIAIGASRWRLVRQLLTETLILFALGAAAGLAVARAITTTLVGLLPTLPFPIDLPLTLDVRILGFTVALSLVAALLSGIAPALHAVRTDAAADLKNDARSGQARLSLRNAFLVAQIALSLLLVVSGGLLLRALDRAGSIHPGFDPSGVELTSLDLSTAGYDDARGRVFVRRLLESVQALPGVEKASAAAVMPLGGNGMRLGPLTIPGVMLPAGQTSLDADWNVVEPGYFSTMRTAIVRGRDFDAGDRADTRDVVIVNETAARRFWPGQDVLGKELVQQDVRPGASGRVRHLVVVGIAQDGKYRSLADPPTSFVFVPLQQQYVPRFTLVIRAREGRRIQTDIRRLLASMDSNLPIVRAQTLEDYSAIGLVPQRVAASVSGSLGVVGLLLAAIGVYGVTAYSVARRTREIGIRVALGATRRDVIRVVARQTVLVTLGGVIIGLGLAAGTTQVLRGLLFGVSPIDPVAFMSAALVFVAVAAAAAYVPARRALKIDPAETLRYE